MGEPMDHSGIPLSCECGTVKGLLQVRGLAVHGACYCRDCQAFARFLGRPERMLNDKGGTEVIGTLPARLRFTSGQERLACITLTPRGPLRWYAECCRTAICNSSRAPKNPFVTIHCRALAAAPAEVDRAFGPNSFALAAQAATAPVAKSRRGFLLAMPKILWNIAYAKLSGAWRINPLFRPGTDQPIRAPQALSKDERYALRGDAPPG
jgi:hypothetical protein